MNTLSDTGEGKARPSVWPVYATAAIIGLIGLAILCPVLSPEGETPPDFTIKWQWQDGAIGLFGIVIALGVVLLRPWAWWFALGFCAIFAALVGGAMLSRYGLGGPPLDWGALVPFGILGFCVWSLATRRRLFFPPKPEREE